MDHTYSAVKVTYVTSILQILCPSVVTHNILNALTYKKQGSNVHRKFKL